jgi:hypothetical protein
VGEDLKTLCHPRGIFAAFLHLVELFVNRCAMRKRLPQNIRGSDRILNREIYAHAADRRHRMRGIADAQKPGSRPVPEAINSH